MQTDSQHLPCEVSLPPLCCSSRLSTGRAGLFTVVRRRGSALADLGHLAFPSQVRGSLPLLRSRHLGNGEQDSVLQPHLASPSHFRLSSWLRASTKTGATGSCVNTRTCKGLSVHVRCRSTITIKTLLHVFARCILKRTLYHIGYVATLYFAECGSVRTNN